ncbi:hypothetical protein KAMAJI_00920 [Serratia phage vB_SmaM-Kamaji]|nr:hypothetical protein KAMAJI_00920 [Serratia phage vB_SmaM-Kamaji]
MDFKRRYIIHPRNTGKTRVTYASHIMKLVLNYISTGDVSYKVGIRQDTAGLVGVTGDRGGVMAYDVLNQFSAMMETWDEFREGSAEPEEDSRYIEVLEEVYNVLDALSGWCAKECWIGSGNYGNRTGVRVTSEGFDVSIRDDVIKLTPST